ncbi:MAG: YggS family pyridoxal phosphate-dependent enzyme [Microthrixaceae bacterium]
MTDTELVERVAASAAAIRDRIAAAGGDPSRVRLIAVTKGHPAEVVAAAVAAGLVDLGESYVQELTAKAMVLEETAEDRAAIGAVPRWHFIGRLQRNKVRDAAPYVSLWQSLDRLSLGAEIARRAPGAAVLVQVNVADESQQGGCPPERVAAVVEGCADLGLDVRGIMAIGVRGTEAETRAGFRVVRDLVERLGLPECSMGMSGDFELAVAEGATMIRVGTALFGPRGETAAVGK